MICLYSNKAGVRTSTSSRSQMLFKIGFLRNITILRENTVLEPLSNKVAGLKACNIIEKRLQHRCFLVNIAKHLRWLLLDFSSPFPSFPDARLYWYLFLLSESSLWLIYPFHHPKWVKHFCLDFCLLSLKCRYEFTLYPEPLAKPRSKSTPVESSKRNDNDHVGISESTIKEDKEIIQLQKELLNHSNILKEVVERLDEKTRVNIHNDDGRFDRSNYL